MSEHKLSAPPSVSVEVVVDHGRTEEGFVRIRKLDLRSRFADGSASEPYRYAMVERTLLDAVAIVLFRRDAEPVRVLLRSQLRPPLAFRHEYDVPLAASGTGAVQWEIPAGLCEPGEYGQAGLFRRAATEALEETGLRIEPRRFSTLGPATSLSPGLIAEKLHFVSAEVFPTDAATTASGDGHPVERGSECTWISLAEALSAVERELIHDIKTEVGLYRLRGLLSSPGAAG